MARLWPGSPGHLVVHIENIEQSLSSRIKFSRLDHGQIGDVYSHMVGYNHMRGLKSRFNI